MYSKIVKLFWLGLYIQTFHRVTQTLQTTTHVGVSYLYHGFFLYVATQKSGLHILWKFDLRENIKFAIYIIITGNILKGLWRGTYVAHDGTAVRKTTKQTKLKCYQCLQALYKGKWGIVCIYRVMPVNHHRQSRLSNYAKK